MELGQPSVRKMLQNMSVNEWHDWLVYRQLTVSASVRTEAYLAQISQTIVNMQRDSKEHPQPFPLKDFLLQFGEEATQTAKKLEKPQSIAEQERNITDWVTGSNRVFEEERGRG